MPGLWQKTVVCKHCTPTDFAFADSLHGLLLVHPSDSLYSRSFFYRTNDGGNSWQKVASVAGVLVKNAPQTLYYPEPGYAMWFFNNLVTEDSGKSWKQIIFPQGRTFQTAIFYGRSTFFRFTTTSSHDFIEAYRDTMNSFDPFYADIMTYPYANSDALFLDSLNILACYYSGYDTTRAYHTLYRRSTDGGSSWKTFLLSDTTKFQTKGKTHFVLGATEGSFYIVGYQINHPVDFFYTLDNGSVWNIDSSHRGRVYRLANPVGSQVWAFIGHIASDYQNDLISASHSFPYGTHFADTLGFSSDNGKTWFHDSHTFIGDTMVSMQWISPTTGFILADKDSSAIVYKYTPVSAVRNRYIQNEYRMELLPDVIHTSQVNFSLPERLKVEIAIYDMIGRKIITVSGGIFESGAHTISLSKEKLIQGIYTVSLQSSLGVISKKLIVIR